MGGPGGAPNPGSGGGAPGGGKPPPPPGATIVPPKGSAGPPKPPGAGGGAGAGAGAAGGGAPGGCGAEPIEGGATPSMVPLSCGFGADGTGAGGGAPPAGGAGAAGAPGRGAAPGWGFIISIVPLNFGAAAPFRLKPHFVQVVAVSGFCVPQFGQNTRHLRASDVCRRAGASLHVPEPDSQVVLHRRTFPSFRGPTAALTPRFAAH